MYIIVLLVFILLIVLAIYLAAPYLSSAMDAVCREVKSWKGSAENQYEGGRMTIFTGDEWFESISKGKKKVEARLGSLETFSNTVGKTVLIKNGPNKAKAQVKAVRHYKDLAAYVSGEGYKKVAPHVKSDEAAIAAYKAIKNKLGAAVFSDEAVKERGGIVAIEFELL